MWFSGKEKSKVADSITIILNILVKVACYSHLFLRQNTMVENFNYSCNLWAFSINKNIKAQFSHHFNHCADHVSCCFVRHRFGLSESGFLYFGIIVGYFCHLFCCSFMYFSKSKNEDF